MTAPVTADDRSNLEKLDDLQAAHPFAYNLVALPLAAAGLLTPIIAGAAMAASSVSVVGNSLLLKRWRAAGASG